MRRNFLVPASRVESFAALNAHLWLRAWVRALTAESLALLSIRIISTSPSPDLGVASATPASTPRAAISVGVDSWQNRHEMAGGTHVDARRVQFELGQLRR